MKKMLFLKTDSYLDEAEINKIKANLPLEANEVFMAEDNLLKITYDSKLNKELIEQPLYDMDYFNIYDIEDKQLESINNSLKKIKMDFMDDLLADTPYTSLDNLFYWQPLSQWKKSEINHVLSNLKKLKKDFENIEDFLFLKDDSENFYDKLMYNIKVCYDSRHYDGMTTYLDGFESNFTEASEAFKNLSKSIEYHKEKYQEKETKKKNSKSKKMSM